LLQGIWSRGFKECAISLELVSKHFVSELQSSITPNEFGVRLREVFLFYLRSKKSFHIWLPLVVDLESFTFVFHKVDPGEMAEVVHDN